MIEEILEDAKDRMEKAVEHVQTEFSTVRTGRANPGILHRVSVDYYGSPTPLQQLASFAVPEPTMLVVSPFDPGALGEIERAINNAGLGLMPSNDGHVIRLAFPPLTEERRKELVRVVNHMAEEGKVAIRNIRRTHKDDLEALKSEMSEDDVRRAEKDLQGMTDAFVARIDELFEHKQTELLEV
jgi:ribosome recycling factor